MIDAVRLKRIRIEMALTQVEFAEHCGISERRLAQLEASPCTVHPSSLRNLAERLGLNPKELLLQNRPPRLLTKTKDLIACNIEIARNAREFLYISGSRSRDTDYLNVVITELRSAPQLVHRRILFGPPRTPQMVHHLHELLELRHSRPEYVEGTEMLGIAIYNDERNYPSEAAICMNESSALIVLPSIVSPWQYDTAIVFETAAVISGWRRWIDALFNSSEQITSLTDMSRHMIEGIS